MVVEGRDIGTVVVPDADAEDLPDRGRRRTGPAPAPAERRRRSAGRSGGPAESTADLAAVAQDLHRRDTKDSTGRTHRCRPPRTPCVIDSSELAVDETVARVLALAQRARHPVRWFRLGGAARSDPGRPAGPRAWTAAAGSASRSSAAMYRMRHRGHGAGCRRTGPVVVVANHQNFMDGAVLFGALTRRVSFLVKAEAVKGPLGWLLINVGQYALVRGVPGPGTAAEGAGPAAGRRCDRHLPGGHPRRRQRRDRVPRCRLAGGPVRRRGGAGRDPRHRSAGRARATPVPAAGACAGRRTRSRCEQGGGRKAVAAATDAIRRHLAALVATLDAEIGRRDLRRP